MNVCPDCGALVHPAATSCDECCARLVPGLVERTPARLLGTAGGVRSTSPGTSLSGGHRTPSPDPSALVLAAEQTCPTCILPLTDGFCEVCGFQANDRLAPQTLVGSRGASQGGQ